MSIQMQKLLGRAKQTKRFVNYEFDCGVWFEVWSVDGREIRYPTSHQCNPAARAIAGES